MRRKLARSRYRGNAGFRENTPYIGVFFTPATKSGGPGESHFTAPRLCPTLYLVATDERMPWTDKGGKRLDAVWTKKSFASEKDLTVSWRTEANDNTENGGSA